MLALPLCGSKRWRTRMRCFAARILVMIGLLLAALCAPAFAQDAAARPGCGRPDRAGRSCRRGAGRSRPCSRSHARSRQHRLDAHLLRARAADDDPRPGALLRRPRPRQEHALGADAGLHHHLPRDDHLGGLRLQPRLHRRRLAEQLRRRLLQGLPRRRRRPARSWRRSPPASSSPSSPSSSSR